MTEIYTDIYKIILSIPKGRVLTYGLISHMIDKRMSAQGVGWALKALGTAKRSKRPAKKSTAKAPYDMGTVPWHRVVNAQGGTSTHKVAGIPPELQRQLLEAEGVVFDDEGKMDLSKYLWMEGVSTDRQQT
jgi:methylated-DNA-protein-cysteine methyltransferase related protein